MRIYLNLSTLVKNGARDETRTHTLVAPPPQGGVATNYTTRALNIVWHLKEK